MVDRASKAALGSVALYSDALESVINIAAAGAAFFALRISAMPADANHPYGHYKAEYFSAVSEGGQPSAAASSGRLPLAPAHPPPRFFCRRRGRCRLGGGRR
jgi:hypothetical protein